MLYIEKFLTFNRKNATMNTSNQRLAKNQLIRNSWIIFPDSVSNHESRIALFLDFDSNQRIENQLFWLLVSNRWIKNQLFWLLVSNRWIKNRLFWVFDSNQRIKNRLFWVFDSNQWIKNQLFWVFDSNQWIKNHFLRFCFYRFWLRAVNLWCLQTTTLHLGSECIFFRSNLYY